MAISNGITYLPYGAVNFRPLPLPDICASESVWCQYVEQGDTFKAQIIMGEMADVVENGDFQNVDPSDDWTGIGWIIVTTNGNNRMQHVPGTIYNLVQAAILTGSTQYKCTFTIADRTVGTLTLSGNPNGVITTNGDYEFYFLTFAPQTDLVFIPTTDFDGSIDDVVCVQIQEDITAVVLDSDDVVVHTFGAGEINQFEDHVRIEDDWADFVLDDGCYSVAITNDSLMLDEQFINNNAGWVLGTNVVITAGVLGFVPVGAETATAVLADALEPGATYTIIIRISSLNAGHNIQATLGATVGTLYVAAGTKTESLVATGTDLTITFTSVGAGTSTIGFITLQKTSIDAVSNCFSLQDSWGCSKLFVWQNTGHWGGYSFEEFPDGTRFEHRLRHIVNFKGGNFPRESDYRITSDGNNNLDYTRLRRVFQMGVSKAKSYIHDAIAAFFSHDTSTIDDVDYVSEDDYDTTPSITDMQTGTLEIQLKTQDLTNTKL